MATKSLVFLITFSNNYQIRAFDLAKHLYDGVFQRKE